MTFLNACTEQEYLGGGRFRNTIGLRRVALDVRPGSARNDAAYGQWPYSKHRTQMLSAMIPFAPKASDFENGVFSQFGPGVILPPILAMRGQNATALREHIRNIGVVIPQKQMCGVDADDVITTMEPPQAVMDRTVSQLPCNFVGGPGASFIIYLSIAAPACLPCPPEPTSVRSSGLVDLFPESFSKRAKESCIGTSMRTKSSASTGVGDKHLPTSFTLVLHDSSIKGDPRRPGSSLSRRTALAANGGHKIETCPSHLESPRRPYYSMERGGCQWH